MNKITHCEEQFMNLSFIQHFRMSEFKKFHNLVQKLEKICLNIRLISLQYPGKKKRDCSETTSKNTIQEQ